MKLKELVKRLKKNEHVWVVNVVKKNLVRVIIEEITINQKNIENDMILVKLSNGYNRYARYIFCTEDEARAYRKAFWSIP